MSLQDIAKRSEIISFILKNILTNYFSNLNNHPYIIQDYFWGLIVRIKNNYLA